MLYVIAARDTDTALVFRPRPLWTDDLKALRPAPAPPPDWASRW